MTTTPCYSCIIVDDEHTARHGLRSYVNRIQHLTCLAELTDVTALDAYLRNHNAPDIIFMDIEMPGQSGLDFIASVEPGPHSSLSRLTSDMHLEDTSSMSATIC